MSRCSIPHWPLIAVLAHLSAPATAQQTRIEAPGGVAAASITNSPITIGLSSEQVRKLTEAAARGATGPLTAAIVDLSKKLGVTEDATKTLLRIVGQQDVPLERLSETLNRVANDYRRLQAQVAVLDQQNPAARRQILQASAAIAAGDFARARDLLRSATLAQIAAAQQARQLGEQARAAESAQFSGAAASTAAQGDLALTEVHYREAADLFGQAAELVPPDRLDDAVDYRKSQADALYREGGERGDNPALIASVEIWRRVLQSHNRERVPLDWAKTQTNLGKALGILGEREAGTARLEQAVAAFRVALEEWTRERVPLDWAKTQTNLGNALQALGEREAGTARLEQAVVVTLTSCRWPSVTGCGCSTVPTRPAPTGAAACWATTARC